MHRIAGAFYAAVSTKYGSARRRKDERSLKTGRQIALRAAGTALAAAVMLGGQVVVPAAAEPAAAASRTLAPTSDVSSGFSDVPRTSQFYNEISWLAAQGISTGYTDGTFRPLQPVNRDAMAAFLYRLAGSPAYTPPAASPFSDVSTSSQFYKEITWLASRGITTGYGDYTFRPLEPVRRDAMAAFLYRSAGKPAYTQPARSPFRDIAGSTQFYREMSWLADKGVSTGWLEDNTYRSLQAVNRDAMAAFMHRFSSKLPPNNQPAHGSTAAAVLATLPIKGRAPKTGYERSEYGPAWFDVDRNGCDTRNDILRAQLILRVDNGCVVESGLLDDPYTGAAINFVRGTATSAAVQIDHVVALSDSWQKGAQQLTPEQRLEFANDPLNLLAADGPANQQKGDGDAATWLPPNAAFRCDYVARQIAVKATYELWVTQAEHDAMATLLSNCKGQLVPTDQTPPVVLEPAPAPEPKPKPKPAPKPTPAPAIPPNPGDTKNCSSFGTWREAQNWFEYYYPHYGDVARLDGNNDGIACESLPGAP